MTTQTKLDRDTTLAAHWYGEDETSALDHIDDTSSMEAAVTSFAAAMLARAKEDAPPANQGQHAGEFAEALFAPDLRAMYLERIARIDWYAIAQRTAGEAVITWRS